MPLVKNITVCQVLSILSLALILSACGGKSNNDDIIKAMEENLSKSNISINYSTGTILKDLQDKTTDWSIRERALVWYANAEKIVNFSNDLYRYLTTIKQKSKLNDSTLKELSKKLVEYKAGILNSDSAIWHEFNNHFEFFHPVLLLFVKDTLTSNKLAPKRISPTILSASLSLLQNYIKINENKIAAFCHSKVGSNWDGFFSYTAIVGQSSSYVKPGEEVKITAGVGAYSRSSTPVININGKNILLENEGFAQYKVKTSKNPGTYIIPVVIEFIDPNTGKKVTNQVNVQYTVAKECN